MIASRPSSPARFVRGGAVLMAGVLALTVAGCFPRAGADEPSPSPSASPTEAAPTLLPVPDVVGLPGDEARTALQDAGFEVEWENETVFAASNWIVTAQSVTEAEEGAEVALTVERPEAPAPAPVEATSGGVTEADAQRVCEEAAIAAYPYGIDFHRILGLLALEIREDRWFYKLEVTITNQYGVELRTEMECTVGGTADAPVIESQYVY